MAREYGSKRSSRRSNGLPQQVLVMVVTFVMGYFTASIFDIETLSHWMTAQVLESHEPQPSVAKAQPQKSQKTQKQKFEFYTLLANEKGVGTTQAVAGHASATPTSPNSPATVPANGAVVSPQTPGGATTTVASTATNTTRVTVNQPAHPQAKPIQVVSAKSVNPPPSRANHYVVQVASFKARNDADQMKGLLILKGFEVSVVPVAMPNQGNWFRVVIGPYPNRVLAQKAQGILARTERLNGMVRSST